MLVHRALKRCISPLWSIDRNILSRHSSSVLPKVTNTHCPYVVEIPLIFNTEPTDQTICNIDKTYGITKSPGIDCLCTAHPTLSNQERQCRGNNCDGSSSGLNNLATFADHLRDIFVLVRQQTKGVSDVVPLSLALGPGQSGSQLAGQLFGVLVLQKRLVFRLGILELKSQLTFSMKEARNLMIRLKRSSSRASSADSRLNMSTK